MTPPTLADLGWSDFFAAQLGAEDTGTPLRITAVQRAEAVGLGVDGTVALMFPPDLSSGQLAVGDWVVSEPDSHRIARVLTRSSLLVRKAAGVEIKPQLIAANVDTLFITTSCNADFNIARLERYVAMALEADCTPVIVLTKADLADDIDSYVAEARAISPRIADVIALNAKDPAALEPLRHWCGPGQTVAFIGSSGVGKSTLIGALTGATLATSDIREDDAKGRHTTTARSVHRIAGGGLLIDMPGMRELALFDAASGIGELFEDIVTLSQECRFRDCAHGGEPGCAIRAAIAAGDLDEGRFERWQKLRDEDAYLTRTVHEARQQGRAFGRMVKQAKRDKTRR